MISENIEYSYVWGQCCQAILHNAQYRVGCFNELSVTASLIWAQCTVCRDHSFTVPSHVTR